MEIKLIGVGIRDLLKCDEVKDYLEEKGKEIKNKAGDGYEMDSRRGRNRTIVEVKAVTEKAKRDNLDHNTLLKALE